MPDCSRKKGMGVSLELCGGFFSNCPVINVLLITRMTLKIDLLSKKTTLCFFGGKTRGCLVVIKQKLTEFSLENHSDLVALHPKMRSLPTAKF